MEKELLQALKALTTECYKGKYQHSNPDLKKAMENAESVIIKAKENGK